MAPGDDVAFDPPCTRLDVGDVRGALYQLGPIPTPHLHEPRSVLVWTPEPVDPAGEPYPVLYMQDGQNLFSDAMAFGREWQLDEALERLAGVGLRAIAVGIPNAGPDRMREYDPFAEGVGGGAAYVRFIVDDVMPAVAARFPVATDRAGVGIAGSSLGALIALYAFFAHGDRFGFCGAFSPALWVASAQLHAFIESRPFVEGRIYLDIGVGEGLEHVARVHALHSHLLGKGYRQGASLLYVEEDEGTHDEAAWARRLRTALYFLLPGAGQ